MTTRNQSALRRTACFCLSIAALISSGAAAQDVTSFTRTTDPLTQSQQQTLQQFVDGGIRGLESDSAEAVVAARQRMIEPLTKSGTSPVFRDAFGKLFIKEVEGMDSGKSLATFNYANIYQVLAFVRTGDSNEFLASCLEPRLGSEGEIRISPWQWLIPRNSAGNSKNRFLARVAALEKLALAVQWCSRDS